MRISYEMLTKTNYKNKVPSFVSHKYNTSGNKSDSASFAPAAVSYERSNPFDFLPRLSPIITINMILALV